MLVIGVGVRGSNQNQLAVRSQLLLSFDLKFLSYATPLIFFMNRQVRKVTGIMKIRHRTRNTYQLLTMPSCNYQIAIFNPTFRTLKSMFFIYGNRSK